MYSFRAACSSTAILPSASLAFSSSCRHGDCKTGAHWCRFLHLLSRDRAIKWCKGTIGKRVITTRQTKLREVLYQISRHQRKSHQLLLSLVDCDMTGRMLMQPDQALLREIRHRQPTHQSPIHQLPATFERCEDVIGKTMIK